ncbi:MAG: ribonuclease HIII [Vampirovibrionia bacterium]
MKNNTEIKSWIGTDESGKGDYFGPLVVAAVHVDSKIAIALSELGVKDCKKITDKKARALAMEIKKITAHDVVMIGNLKYNELYNKFNNLNTLLGWAHARAIENVLEKTDCKYVLTDKFADSKVMLNSLMKKGKEIKLEQRTKAEDDIAVAAASILARAAFLYGMEKLAKEAGMPLSKGASSQVLEQAKTYVEKFGANSLGKIAKLHFKSTKTVLGQK